MKGISPNSAGPESSRPKVSGTDL